MHVRTHIYTFATDVKCDVVVMSLTHQDNHPGVVTNCAKFGVGRPNSFLSIKRNTPKNRKNSCFI